MFFKKRKDGPQYYSEIFDKMEGYEEITNNKCLLVVYYPKDDIYNVITTDRTMGSCFDDDYETAVEKKEKKQSFLRGVIQGIEKRIDELELLTKDEYEKVMKKYIDK